MSTEISTDSPQSFSNEFLEDLFYSRDVLFFDRIEQVDRAQNALTCRMPTTRTLPLTSSQQGDPRLHPPHVNGGLLIHLTGMLGWIHAYHLEGLRHREGWVGFGTHIRKATFRKLAPLGPHLVCTVKLIRARRLRGRIFSTYAFWFEQENDVVFESEQSAIWMKDAIQSM